MQFNLADLYESVADRVPEREAVVWGGTRLTFRQLDERATRLAHGLQALGVGPAGHVGILTYSRPEYLETMVAAFKIRAVPINVNYRYVADELAYLFANADLVALVLESTFAPVVASVRDRLPRLAHLIVVEDGTDGDVRATRCRHVRGSGRGTRSGVGLPGPVGGGRLHRVHGRDHG